MGLAIYVVLVRRGAPRWAAVLAAAPILLDGYQLQLEQSLMPDVAFEAFILGGLTILLWKPRPGLVRILTGAFVLGLATDFRQVGEVLIVPVAVFAALVARGGWRRAAYLGLAAVCCAVPMLGYMTISQVTGNGFALASRGTDVFYGRAAVAANCSTLKLPRYETPLCPDPAVAALGIDRIINNADGPYQSYAPPPGTSKEHAVDGFVARVATQQPLAMPLSTLRDAVRLFALTRDGVDSITPISRWQFQPTYATYPPGVTLQFVAGQGQHYGGGGPKTIRPLATFLRDYQLYGGYTPGPLLAAMTATGVAGSLFVFARRRRKTGRRSTADAGPATSGPATSGPATTDDRMLAAGTLLATLSAAAVLLGSDVFEFSWRYQLPALVTLPLAGVLGGTLIAGRVRARHTRRTRRSPDTTAEQPRESLTAERPSAGEGARA
jgi:hypothetical protein